ncbi:MspA protein [Mycobacteriaceae bacterium 1482268.1]|nr:MspA protein [Mycobacteriaceae bacterium 1482268.1]
MFNRFATLAAACMLVPVGTAPLALADEPAPPVVPAGNAGAPGSPGPAGPVPSAPPGVLKTPDGYTLTVGGSNESMEPVAALTGAPTSREYLVDGSFTGSVTGSGGPKLAGGTLEAGYQIGCGIAQDDIESIISAGITPGIGIPFTNGSIFPITIQPSLSYQMKIDLKPGTVSIVPVDKKSFKGTSPKINVTGLRVKFDQCAGSSFIRSYATLTSSTDDTDDVVTYVGVTKMV